MRIDSMPALRLTAGPSGNESGHQLRAPMSALPLKADIGRGGVDVREVPIASFCAAEKQHPHSITSSAAQQWQNAKYHAVQIVKLSAVRHD
jgi:hypothetical protein